MNGEKPLVPDAAAAAPHRRRGRGSMATGLVVMLVGVLFLLDNLHFVHFHLISDAWPLIIVVLGVVRLIDAPERGSGLWLIAIGLWLLVNEFELWGLTYHDSWPLLIVFAGLSMVWKAMRGSPPPPTKGSGQ